MDISYLLWLEGIRTSLPGFVETLFVVISAIAASSALIIIPCLLYWCLDKRGGELLLFSFTIGTMVNQLVKNTVCAYRPWIRSEALNPSQGALPEATGYSFPSGHTQTAATVIGAFGWRYRRKWPWLNVACWAFVVLVAFSRNFLGVHTPQDVLVAILESVAVIFASTRLLEWVDESRGNDRTVAIVAAVFTVVYLLYILLKPYPMTYNEAGELLVSPQAMQVDCFKSGGIFAGAIIGWYLERTYIGFEGTDKRDWKRIAVRLVVGLAVVAILHNVPKVLSITGMDIRWLEFLKNFCTGFAATFAGPPDAAPAMRFAQEIKKSAMPVASKKAPKIIKSTM